MVIERSPAYVAALDSIHRAQWLPDRVCALRAPCWESLSDDEKDLARRLANLSGITIALEPATGYHAV